MSNVLQILIFIFALSYKYFLARGHILGWIFSAITGMFSAVYLILYAYLPILICLEFSFLALSIYGIHKHLQNVNVLTKTDKLIIFSTFLIITFLIFKQLETRTIWYEIIASISFLAGVVLLAQKPSSYKVSGWILYILGLLCYGIIMYKRNAYVLVTLDAISILLCIYGIYKIYQKKRKIEKPAM